MQAICAFGNIALLMEIGVCENTVKIVHPVNDAKM